MSDDLGQAVLSPVDELHARVDPILNHLFHTSGKGFDVEVQILSDLRALTVEAATRGARLALQTRAGAAHLALELSAGAAAAALEVLEPLLQRRARAGRRDESADRVGDAVVREAGVEALNRVWESPAMLPSSAELDAPLEWLRRTGVPRRLSA